jgi:hypothetical protein
MIEGRRGELDEHRICSGGVSLARSDASGVKVHSRNHRSERTGMLIVLAYLRGQRESDRGCEPGIAEALCLCMHRACPEHDLEEYLNSFSPLSGRFRHIRIKSWRRPILRSI